MKNNPIFQCIPCYKPKPTARLIQSLWEIDCKILLDLEDSIQDVQNPSITATLKQQARKDFEEIIRSFPDKKFSVRINTVNSLEFHLDEILLKKFASSIESVFIPKVECSGDIETFYSASFPSFKIVLIIESQKGIESLDEILSSKFSENIEYVFFGNYDFHLDTNIYPIQEQHSENYWKIVKPLIAKVEKYPIKFGNSPYANIADTQTLDFSLMQLKKYCKKEFALMSLHKSQTYHFKKTINHSFPSISTPKLNNQNSFTLASFALNKQKGRSFSFAANRIITPQEFLLVLRKQHE